LARARKAAKDAEWATAHACYQSVLERFPGNKRAKQGMDALRPVALPALLKLTQAAQSSRKWAAAEQHLTVAVALAPEMLYLGLALAECQMQMRRAPAALITLDDILERAPGNPEALNQKGRALRWMGRGDDAQACFQSALGHATTDAQTLRNLGILARGQGNNSAATEYYRRAIALQPKNIELHRNLAQVITYTKGDPHLDEMRALLASSDQTDTATAPLYFALFKALDDLNQPAEAFAFLEKGNQLTKAALGYDFQKNAMTAALSKTLFQKPVDKAEETGGLRPIFVTGLPRSGTTLVERILARASGVQPCGELSVAQTATVRLLRTLTARPHKALTRDDIEGLRAELLQGFAEYSDGSLFLVDKTPLNFLWIGYICAALPEARIIHLSRDPMAVAWSVYSRSFDGAGNGFAYNPADIARFMVLHGDLMAHWRAVFPGRIFDLNYEELVSNPEKITHAMAEATGLEWSPDWLTPEQATNQVLTASADQVRKPIYRDSNKQWKRYEAQLAPMVHALSEVGLVPR
jgi:tetratricopeptide (TPR) repeat protein